MRINSMRINIKDKEIELKYTFRAYIIYEQITDENFTPKGLKEIITLFYSFLMSSDRDNTITFDEFVDYLDENPTVLDEFSQWLKEHMEVQRRVSKEGEGEPSKN